MFISKFPVIDIKGYTLREQQESDVESFFEYYTDPIVNKYILSQIPKTIEETKYELNYWRQIFYNDQGIYFAIARNSDDKMIGSIGLTTYNSYHSRIELSYDIAKEYWRQGIATRAIKEMIKLTFFDLNINRLEAFSSTFNEASIKLLQKCGFEYEGKLRQHRYHRGKYVDVYSFSILKEDFAKDPNKYIL